MNFASDNIVGASPQVLQALAAANAGAMAAYGGDEITKRVIVLDMQVSEQSIRFRDLVSPIKMVKPLPVP